MLINCVLVAWCKTKKSKKFDNLNEQTPNNGIESLLKASVLTTKYVE